MLRGAKSQGKFPGLSMELSRPYVDLVLRTLANEAARTELRTAVRDQDEELLPFEFSYDALPFSIALAVARIKGGESARSEQYVRLVLEALHTLASQIRAAAPPYQIAKYIIDESELRILHAMSREAGDEEPFPEFLKSPCRWSLLLDTIFVPRGVKIFEATNSIMAEACGSREAKFVVLAQHCARLFLTNATIAPTLKKEAAAADHFLDLFFELGDIPSFRG